MFDADWWFFEDRMERFWWEARVRKDSLSGREEPL